MINSIYCFDLNITKQKRLLLALSENSPFSQKSFNKNNPEDSNENNPENFNENNLPKIPPEISEIISKIRENPENSKFIPKEKMNPFMKYCAELQENAKSSCVLGED